MIGGKKILGVVTARGGSKGLPGKNARPLLGKPLLHWTVEAGLAAPSLDALVLSTDDPTLAQLGRAAGARVPFIRPAELATDNAASVDVVLHAVDALRALGERYDIAVLLEPTSPLREASDIENALAQLVASDAASVVGICRAESHHPTFMFRLAGDRRLSPFTNRQPNGLRRQDIEPIYFIEGTVYCTWIDALRERRSFYHEDTLGYEVPKWKSPEIDDIYDFVIVEALMQYREQKA